MCKHLGQVERRAEREGWTFGQIAPLSKVARYFPLDIPQNIAKRGAVLTVAPAPAADLDALRARKRRALTDLYGPEAADTWHGDPCPDGQCRGAPSTARGFPLWPRWRCPAPPMASERSSSETHMVYSVRHGDRT